MFILLILGHNWLGNQTWYSTQKIPYSFETKKKKQMNLARKCYPHWKYRLQTGKRWPISFHSLMMSSRWQKWNLLVRVKGVLRRTVSGDWRFNMMDDFSSWCWNVSHYQQPFSGLLSPARANERNSSWIQFIDLIKHFLPDWNSSQMAWHTSFKKAFKITSWVHILSTSAFPFEKKPTHNLLLLGVSTKIPPSTDLVFRSKTWSLSLGVNSYKFLHSDA